MIQVNQLKPQNVLTKLDPLLPFALKHCSVSHKYGSTAVLLEQQSKQIVYASIY
jgi:hypothetical protein